MAHHAVGPFLVCLVVSASLLLTLAPASSDACTVDLYEHADHEGERFTASCNACLNLPGRFQNWASSLNTYGGCVRLYENWNCNVGYGAQNFYPNGPCPHNDLAVCNADLPSGQFWNDRVKSIGAC